MEHISEVLGNLSPETNITGQKIIEPQAYYEDGLTLEERREQLRKSLGVSSLEHTFENFWPVKGTREALAAFRALAQGKTSWKMLLCYGGVGNGKTHLCEASAIALYKRGLFCRVLTMARIMRALKQHMEPGLPFSYDELMEHYCSSERLIIDEIEGTEWEFGRLQEIVVARSRDCLFTILATNRDLNELPERIVSRFSDPDVGRLILNEGVDYRKLKLKGG